LGENKRFSVTLLRTEDDKATSLEDEDTKIFGTAVSEAVNGQKQMAKRSERTVRIRRASERAKKHNKLVSSNGTQV